MSDGSKEPTNGELLAALQGMWRQQKDLVSGIETRLASKVDALGGHLDERLKATEQQLGERLAREIQAT